VNLLLCALICGAVVPTGQSKAQSLRVSAAEESSVLLGRAAKEAKSHHKAIYVVFSASWCGGCQAYRQSFLGDPQLQKILSKYFIFVILDVQEKAGDKARENPGAVDLMNKWAGLRPTLPFWAVLDGSAQLKGTGIDGSGQSVAAPYESIGVGRYLRVLHTANPRISTEDLWSLRRRILSPEFGRTKPSG